MRNLKFYLPANHELVFAGDLHDGSLFSFEDGFLECREYVLSKSNRRLWCMGDMMEGITIDDPRYDIASHESLPLQSKDHVAEILKPLKKQLLGGCIGNHEWKLRRFGNLWLGVCQDLTKDLENHTVEYGTMSAVLEIYSLSDPPDLMYKVFVHHGSFLSLRSQAKDYEQQQGNIKATFKRRMSPLMSDCLVMAAGHTHRLMVVPPTERLYLYSDQDKLKQGYLRQGQNGQYINPDQRWYVNTGSFYRLYADRDGHDGIPHSGYAEQRGYEPMEIGFASVVCHDHKLQEVKGIKI